MTVKHVQFQIQPETVHYYQTTSNNKTRSIHNTPSPTPLTCANLPSKTKQQHQPSTIVKSDSLVPSKRPAIPPLDFTHLHHHALQPHTTNTDINTISLSRPLSPPILSIDTLHYTPLYYTSLSTYYF